MKRGRWLKLSVLFTDGHVEVHPIVPMGPLSAGDCVADVLRRFEPETVVVAALSNADGVPA